MAILFGVFGVIYVAVYYISYNQNLSNIEHTLDETATTFYLPDGSGTHSKTIIVTINKNSFGSDYVMRGIWFDDDTFTELQAKELISEALAKSFKSGRIDNVFFKIYQKEDSRELLVAVDATDSILMFEQNVTRAFFVLLTIYIIMLLIVMKLSWWVLKPLRESFDKQKQFVSNASHELKTPISIISANADALKQEADNKWVENIKSQTTRMSELVDDMLSLAKIDEGNIKLIYEKFNISELVVENALSFDAVAFEKGKTLNIDVQSDIIINSNKESIKKIVGILLDNAIKHASDKGEVAISLRKENNKTVLSVFNTGSKIAKENANKIFERFYRGDNSRSRESGGSGLGLSIAKNICDANKWKISAVSIPDVSMTITVIL